MDKIQDRKFFEVGGHWPLWKKKTNGRKKRMSTLNRQKSNAKKTLKIFWKDLLAIFGQDKNDLNMNVRTK